MQCRFCQSIDYREAEIVIKSQPCSAQGFTTTQIEAEKTVDISIYQCGTCGLIQHASPPVPYYKNVIRATAFSDSMAAFRKKQLGTWIKKWDLASSYIVEAGSGKGEYLDILRDLGCSHLYGIENSSENTIFLKQNGYEYHQGFLDKTFNNPWSHEFKALVCFNFLEHWPDLKDGLRKIKDLLQPNGVALIEVPNFSHMIESGVFSEFTADHIFYFTESSLNMVLRSAGFEIISLTSIWSDYILSAEIRKPLKENFSNLNSKKELVSNQILKYFIKYENEIVVWGAGHQSLSILSMTNAKTYVSYVVDTAPFKQNMFCPGSGLAVHNPSHLKHNPPKALMIIAGGYNREIVHTVLSRFPEIPTLLMVNETGVSEVK